MADPAAAQQLALLPSVVLEEIIVRLPPKEFRRCRCLSRKWAATLSSDELIDRHLHLRGKIRVGYHDVMLKLVLECCLDKEFQIESEGEGDFSDEKESSDENPREENPGEDDDGDGDGGGDGNAEYECWREEYRTRGYVEVDEDYYIRRAELEAWSAEQWAKKDFSGITFAGPDDEYIKAITVPYGVLPPRIHQPFMEEDDEEDSSLDSMESKKQGLVNIKQIRGREKTEEEVDREIIAFLRRLRDMEPQPQFLRELDTYRWPGPVPQQWHEEDGQDDDWPVPQQWHEQDGQDDDSEHSDNYVEDEAEDGQEDDSDHSD